MSTDIVVHATADLLARAAAARLVTRLVDAQAASGLARIVLTGGRVGGAVLRQLRDSPARDAVDWSRVEIWWGDERWLPDGDAERNDKQARDELLSSVAVDPRRVHPFPAADGRYAGDPEAAAAAYAAELAKATRPEDHGPVPRFDVLMLGVGEEGHVASIFPESPAAYETRPVVAVRGSPKPPPTRLTLTFPAIASATDVWLMTAGVQKAGAVALALGGAGAIQVPAAGVHGRAHTLWLLDRESAAKLPPSVLRLPIG